MKYKSKVWKCVTCPRCGTEYAQPLEADEKERMGVMTCFNTTNENMKRRTTLTDGTGFDWLYCGQVIAYDISRGHTSVAAVPAWQSQPNRLRREKADEIITAPPPLPSTRPPA